MVKMFSDTVNIFVALTGEPEDKIRAVVDVLRINYRFISLSFYDPIKEIVELFEINLTDSQFNGDIRKILQLVEYVGRMIDRNVWCRRIENKVKDLVAVGAKRIVVSELRQESDCEYLQRLGFLVVKFESEEISGSKERINESLEFVNFLENRGEKNEIFNFKPDLVVLGNLPEDYLVSLIINFCYRELITRTRNTSLVTKEKF